jgi:mono/diheme cytochrome c family protein
MLLAFCVLPLHPSDAQETRPTGQEVFAILKEKCSQCHGEAVQMGGLDLRTRDSILKGGESGPAIVVGDAKTSRLYRRIAGLEKPAMPMAPLPPLTPQEVAAVKSWIEKGAQLGASNNTRPGDAKLVINAQ